MLVEHFLRKFCRQYDREAPRISPETVRLLQEYSWPGNVRELENMIKRLVVLQNEDPPAGGDRHAAEPALGRPRETIPVTTPPPPPPQMPGAPTIREAGLGLKEIAKRAALEAEKTVLKEVLERVRWNRAEAASLLKISYKALLYKITAAGLDGKVDRRSKKK